MVFYIKLFYIKNRIIFDQKTFRTSKKVTETAEK